MYTAYLLRLFVSATITANKDPLRFSLEGLDDAGSLTVLEDINEATFSEMIGRGIRPIATDVAGALWL